MPKYRKKPVVIEAVQFLDTVESIVAVSDFAGDTISIDYSQDPPMLKIKTLEGIMTARPGDFIIKGVKGEFYACKPDIFEQTYEPVKE